MAEPLARAGITRKNLLARALWTLVWMLLFRPTPRPLHAWRAMLLRCFGARIGRRVRIYQSARIWAPWNLTMGDEACLGDHVDCYCVAPVVLGRASVVSQYSYLCTASHDYADLSLPLVAAPITVGPSAWVTADVFVAPGITIGEGAVVRARSSVFDDIEPWTVAAGNPARLVGQRRLRAPGTEAGADLPR